MVGVTFVFLCIFLLMGVYYHFSSFILQAQCFPLVSFPTKTKIKTKTKETTRTGAESEKGRSHEGISVGRGKGGIEGKRYREGET